MTIRIKHANAGPGMCLLHPRRPGMPIGPYRDGQEFLCTECVARYFVEDPVPGAWPSWFSALQPLVAVVAIGVGTGLLIAAAYLLLW